MAGNVLSPEVRDVVLNASQAEAFRISSWMMKVSRSAQLEDR
jgi:hypothetical protein